MMPVFGIQLLFMHHFRWFGTAKSKIEATKQLWNNLPTWTFIWTSWSRDVNGVMSIIVSQKTMFSISNSKLWWNRGLQCLCKPLNTKHEKKWNKGSKISTSIFFNKDYVFPSHCPYCQCECTHIQEISVRNF